MSSNHPRKVPQASFISHLCLRSLNLVRGWIDLDKNRKRAVILLLVTISIGAVYGASKNDSPVNSRQPGSSLGTSLSSWFSSPGPASGGGELKLAREYLYSDSGLLAVEDANATSSPPADLAIWRPSTGQWWTQRSEYTSQVTVPWGASTDVPTIGDYDGDGKTDFCVFRPAEGRWYLIKSGSGDSATTVIPFGSNGDVPAPADFDGDGRTDMAVWRPASGTWYIRKSSDLSVIQLPLGSIGDTPNPQDFDGDGRADIAVWRSATKTFYSVNSSDGEMAFTIIGMQGLPVSADYDGDGSSDYAVREGAVWKIKQSSDGAFRTVSWQEDDDIAIHNDYDGDGRVDIAAWSPHDGKWHILQSSTGTERVEQWGMNGDIPLPALYRR